MCICGVPVSVGVSLCLCVWRMWCVCFCLPACVCGVPLGVCVCVCSPLCGGLSPVGWDPGPLSQALASVPDDRVPGHPQGLGWVRRDSGDSASRGGCWQACTVTVPGPVANSVCGGWVSVVISRDRTLRKPLSQAPECLSPRGRVFSLRSYFHSLFKKKKKPLVPPVMNFKWHNICKMPSPVPGICKHSTNYSYHCYNYLGSKWRVLPPTVNDKLMSKNVHIYILLFGKMATM